MSRAFILLILSLAPLTVARAAEPGSQLQFLALPSFNQRQDAKWGPVLTDIVNHEAPGDSNPYDALVTKGHETTHGINSYIRNKMGRESTVFASASELSDFPLMLRSRRAAPGEARVNGFYVLEDRAVQVAEPNIRKKHMIPYVPASLRGPRYQLYVVGQTAWDDTPLYIWDEWTAYVNGALVGVDLVERGLWTYGWQDAAYGPLEFTVYALAIAMAVKEKDPAYFASNQQFREMLAFNSRRAMDVYHRGAGMAAFKYDKQEQYLASLRTGADAAALRDFTRQLFGADWTTRVFGF